MSTTPLDRIRALVADEEIPDGRFIRVDCEDFCEAMEDGPDETPALTKLWNAADGPLRAPGKYFIPSAGDLRQALAEYDAHKAPASATNSAPSVAAGSSVTAGSSSNSTGGKSKS